MKTVPTIGRGQVRPGGIPNGIPCTTCNLHPVGGISRVQRRRGAAASSWFDDDDDVYVVDDDDFMFDSYCDDDYDFEWYYDLIKCCI